jgi:hypothetical protein
MVSQVRVTRAVNNQGDGTLFDRSQSTPLREKSQLSVQKAIRSKHVT